MSKAMEPDDKQEKERTCKKFLPVPGLAAIAKWGNYDQYANLSGAVFTAREGVDNRSTQESRLEPPGMM